MSDIQIKTRSGQTWFAPRQTIEGSASWNLGTAPQGIEIRLLWFTRGKGTRDANIVESNQIASPPAMGDTPFRFVLPDAPHSFNGQLIALVWAIEVVVMSGRQRQSELWEFQMTPQGREIVLPRIEKPLSPLQSKWKNRVTTYATQRGLDPDNYRK